MRVNALKLLLAILGTSAVIALGMSPAAAQPADACSDVTLHLTTSGGNLVLDDAAPGVRTAKFADSPVLQRTGGNPYQVIGKWANGFASGTTEPGCLLQVVGPLHVWLGLRNSDDQGTNFDLKARVSFKPSDPGAATVLVAEAEELCIKGVTRNPALAKEILVDFPSLAPPSGDGEFILELAARIGTPQSTCGGHTGATGLRLYYDAANRDSRFDMFFFENACS